MRALHARMAVAGLTLAMAACSGASLPSTGKSGTALPVAHRMHVNVRVKIPRAAHRVGGRSHPRFIAPSTQGINIAAFPPGNHTGTPLAQVAADISATSPLCSAVSGGRLCAVALDVQPGNHDFVVTTYDAPPSGGGFAGAKALAAGETNATITSGASNAIGITLGGIVASVSIGPARLFAHTITSSVQNLTVAALDADGNVIVSDGYLDANGNPVTIAVTAGSSAGVTVNLAPSVLASPSPTGVTLTYTASRATSSQVQSGFSTVLSATASNGVPVASNVLVALSPKPTPYDFSSAFFLSTLTAGGDGAMWLALSTENDPLRMTTAGSFSVFGGTFSDPAVDLAEDPSGNVWFTECSGSIGMLNPLTSASNEFAPPPSVTSAEGITAGPTGDPSMWFTDDVDGVIGRVSTVAPNSIQTYGPVTEMQVPNFIAAGRDGNLWFTDCGTGAIGTISPTSPTGTSAVVTEFAITPMLVHGGPPKRFKPPGRTLGVGRGRGRARGRLKPHAPPGGSPLPYDIVAGPDGNLWFTDITNFADNGAVGSITTSGVIDEIDTGGGPRGIVTGPDGALWFTQALTDQIGRIDPVTRTLTEYPSVADQPDGIAVGPDGALYITSFISGIVVRFQ
jgi:virginiamycin B lyase